MLYILQCRFKNVNKIIFIELNTSTLQLLAMELQAVVISMILVYLVRGDTIEFPDYECAKNQYYNPITLGKKD